MKIINVSNGNNNYPGNFTPKEIKMSEKKCCTLRDGIHDWWCKTNHEYAHYRCKNCGKEVPQFEMSFSLCSKCQEKRLKDD